MGYADVLLQLPKAGIYITDRWSYNTEGEIMLNIMIHACPQRMWYVEGYLIPKLKEQGIENITVWEDKDHKGNLESCMQSFLSLPEDGNTWHLQDDVVISKDFRQLAEAYDNGRRIACGINTLYDGFVRGTTALCNMWYSFPCIYIPNKMARECAEWWYEKDRSGHKDLKGIVEYGNGDDSVFRLFLYDKYPNIYVQNVYPNMVDHIDYLIGGSRAHSQRKQKEVRARWWNEVDVIADLERWLADHRPNQ